MTVGDLVLHACGRGPRYCGVLYRALDPDGRVPGRLPIYFEFYPHANRGASQGTLVASEGGPGYPATQSREDYQNLFRPLMTDHDVLIMDNRGTGRSGAVDCPELQRAEKWTVERVAACGQLLGPRAPLYSTAYAADDLAALLDALGVGTIDLYGDSYGTYFEQVFAVRHPHRLRSLVLDGAYPLTGTDYAWYPTYAPAMRDKLNTACERAPGCRAVPGSSIDHILPALTMLRSHPFATGGRDVDGRYRRFAADASQLAIVMFGNAPALTTIREVDAAARAYAAGDQPPLMRLMAETASAVDSRDPTGDAAQWSAGLAAAVLCQDPPQIFDMRLPPAERAQDRDRALAARRGAHPDTYAPFSIDEYRGMPLDYSFLDECVGWPAPSAQHPASQLGVDAKYPDVPALVISGDLDSITTPADGAAVAAAFARGVQLRIANGFHVNALDRGRGSCAAQVARRFMATLNPGDTSCASQAPPVRLVPRFVLHAADLDPAAALPGNQADPGELRKVAAALFTAGDLLARAQYNTSGRGNGLRGGSYRLSRDAGGVHLRLERVQWVLDLAVSGRIDATPGRAARVIARLRLDDAGRGGRLILRWREGADRPLARINGTLGSARVAAQNPAP